MKAVSITVSLICKCTNVIRAEHPFVQRVPTLAEACYVCNKCGTKFYTHIQESNKP